MSHYVIRGGEEGRRRLAVLSRTLWPTTGRLLRRAGLAPGMSCLDLGCGGGDVALEMAGWVGEAGRVLGLDMDETKLAAARRAAGERGLENATFRRADADEWEEDAAYDLVYSRFLLTHLRDPQTLLRKMWQATRPGGRVVVEEIDFSGHFCHPPSPAFARYLELYRAVVARRGGDADLGLRLHALASAAGWQNLRLEVVQPAFAAPDGPEGEGKQMAQITLENVAGAILEEGLASESELAETIAELSRYTAAGDTLLSLPRIFQLVAVKAEEPTP